MKDIQEIFEEIKICVKEQKEIRAEYKDSLLQADDYEEIKDKMEELKEKKKEIEMMVQSRMGSRWDKMEELKIKMADLKQAQSDIAMSTLMAGKNIQVKDEFDNLYEPQFSVTFKKTIGKKID